MKRKCDRGRSCDGITQIKRVQYISREQLSLAIFFTVGHIKFSIFLEYHDANCRRCEFWFAGEVIFKQTREVLCILALKY